MVIVVVKEVCRLPRVDGVLLPPAAAVSDALSRLGAYNAGVGFVLLDAN